MALIRSMSSMAGPPHRRPDVGDDHRWQVPVDPRHVLQVPVVDLAVVLALDHHVARVQHPEVLENAVVGFLREVEYAVGEHFPGEVQPVQVPLGPAGCDVAPGQLRVQPHQAGEAGDDLPFDAVGVAPVVAAVEGVPDVVQ